MPAICSLIIAVLHINIPCEFGYTETIYSIVAGSVGDRMSINVELQHSTAFPILLIWHSSIIFVRALSPA